MKRTFRLVVDLVFEDDEGIVEDEIQALSADQLKDQINGSLAEGSYDFFGESVCMAGLLTPEVGSIEEVS